MGAIVAHRIEVWTPLLEECGGPLRFLLSRVQHRLREPFQQDPGLVIGVETVADDLFRQFDRQGSFAPDPLRRAVRRVEKLIG